MENVLWFSRHEPTAEQIKEITEDGTRLIRTDKLKALAELQIDNQEQACAVYNALVVISQELGAERVYGVWPVDLLALFHRIRATGHLLPFGVYGAANKKRALEGQMPTFEHREWLRIA